MHHFILISYFVMVAAAIVLFVAQIRSAWLSRPRKGEPGIYKPFFRKEPPCQK